MRLGLLSFSVFAASVLAVPTARAADPATDADALYQSGKQAMERGDLATACAQLAESQRLDPAAGTLLNLATCEERSGKLAAALTHFRDSRARLPAGDFRMGFADQRISELTRRVARMTPALTGTPDPGAVVLCDGTEVARASLGTAMFVDPGKHACLVRAPGRADALVEVVLREGDERTVELAQGARTQRTRDNAPDQGKMQRTLGLVAGGAGVAGIAVGAIFGVLSKGTYDDAKTHCPAGPASCDAQGVQGGDSAHTQATVSTVGFVAGAVLLGGGAALYLTAPKSGQVSLAPAVGATSAGLNVRGAW
jgi:hypothetical protein